MSLKKDYSSLPVRAGTTYRFRGASTIFITINQDDSGLDREVFVVATSSGSTTHALCDALGRVISIALQENPLLQKRIVKSLSGISSESVFSSTGFEQARSIPDAVALVLGRKHGDDKKS